MRSYRSARSRFHPFLYHPRPQTPSEAVHREGANRVFPFPWPRNTVRDFRVPSAVRLALPWRSASQFCPIVQFSVLDAFNGAASRLRRRVVQGTLRYLRSQAAAFARVGGLFSLRLWATVINVNEGRWLGRSHHSDTDTGIWVLRMHCHFAAGTKYPKARSELAPTHCAVWPLNRLFCRAVS
jgi:hypothetical protein